MHESNNAAIRPWTFAAYSLWCDETTYQIWTQSNNPRRSYCDFIVWPYDLEHVLSVALGFGIIFTKFDIRPFLVFIYKSNTEYKLLLDYFCE